MADLGEGPGGAAPLLLDQTEARGKKFVWRPLPPSFSNGQDDRPLAYRKVLIRHCVPLLHTNPVIFTAGFVVWYYR